MCHGTFRAMTRPHCFIRVEHLSFCWFMFLFLLFSFGDQDLSVFLKGSLFFLFTNHGVHASFSLPQQYSLSPPNCQKQTWVFSTKLSMLLRIRKSTTTKKDQTYFLDVVIWSYCSTHAASFSDLSGSEPAWLLDDNVLTKQFKGLPTTNVIIQANCSF